MRGSSAATQDRDTKTGRFTKSAPIQLGDQTWRKNSAFFPIQETRRASRLSTFTRLLSHHRMAILGYTGYLVLIALISILGAYYGAKIGLR